MSANITKGSRTIDASKLGCAKAVRAKVEDIVKRLQSHHDCDIPEFVGNLVADFGVVSGFVQCAREGGKLDSIVVHVTERNHEGKLVTTKMPITSGAKAVRPNPFANEMPLAQKAPRTARPVTSEAQGPTTAQPTML